MIIVSFFLLQNSNITLPDDISLIGLVPLSLIMSYLVDLLKRFGALPDEGQPKKLIATGVATFSALLGLGSYYAVGPIVGNPGPAALTTQVFIGLLVGFAAVGYKSTVKNTKQYMDQRKQIKGSQNQL